MLEKIKLQIQIIQIQLKILLLKQRLTVPNLSSPKFVVVHHGADKMGFEQVNEYHRKLWNFKSSLGYYAGYHKFIEYGGKLHIARRDNEEGAHAVEKGNSGWWNKNSVGICLQGNMEKEKPTEWQLRTLKRELESYGLPVKMHCEISSTLCPGKHLKEWVEEYRNVR
jgi:N-acetylmuramoyl-L-alanine amidase